MSANDEAARDAGPIDPYSRTEYRRLIAWEKRIAREAPFLERQLAGAPDRSVLDIGCGTGEHTAFFARAGARAVGLDRSESMLEAARDHEARGEGRFLEGDVLDAHELLAGEAPFGLAICLGNMLPHVLEDVELAAFVAAVHDHLAPGGTFLLQILNYERILSHGVRALPVNVRPGEGNEEIVFLRLLKPGPDGSLLFFPTTLVLDPEADHPVRVEGTKRVPLRPWTRRDLVPAFDAAGFDVRWHGDMEGGAFEPTHSSDLVVVARRR